MISSCSPRHGVRKDVVSFGNEIPRIADYRSGERPVMKTSLLSIRAPLADSSPTPCAHCTRPVGVALPSTLADQLTERRNRGTYRTDPSRWIVLTSKRSAAWSKLSAAGYGMRECTLLVRPGGSREGCLPPETLPNQSIKSSAAPKKHAETRREPPKRPGQGIQAWEDLAWRALKMN